MSVELVVEPRQAGGGAWAAQSQVECADGFQPVQAIITLPSHQRVLEQGQERNGSEAFGGGSS